MHVFMEMCMALFILLLVNNVASRSPPIPPVDGGKPPIAGPHPVVAKPLPPLPKQKPWPLPPVSPVLLPPIPAGLEPVEEKTGREDGRRPHERPHEKEGGRMPHERPHEKEGGRIPHERPDEKEDDGRDTHNDMGAWKKEKLIEKMKHDREVDWSKYMAMKGGYWEKINHAKRMDWDKCMKGKRNDWERIEREKKMKWEYFKKVCGEKCDEMMRHDGRHGKHGKRGRHGRRMGWEYIVAIVCGVVFVLAGIIGIAILCAKSKKNNSVSDEKSEMPPAYVPDVIIKTDISKVTPQYTMFVNEQ